MASGKREIVFDTETTGFDAKGADRVTEIGCVEIIDLMPTGNNFHSYIDPLRDIPEKVTEITGLTREFLDGKPLFKDKAQEFLDFVGDAQLVAHNAEFDMGFINAELARAGFEPIAKDRFTDTLKIARAKFPGSPASLDALCKRFNISLAKRGQHGALIDAQLLAEVYLDLSGGRMRKFGFSDGQASDLDIKLVPVARRRETPLPSLLSDEEKNAHIAFVKKFGGEDGTAIWQKHWAKLARKSQ
ncbi:MAG: DNA polymerase III subunit epsilon [Hellea sp.]|nr:DNA polymerase III subunit epsilon [Hellea sp.]